MGGKAAEPTTEVERQRAAILAEYYTVKDVLALLADPPVCEKTFRRMCERGEFTVPKTIMARRLVVYKKELVHAWYEDEFLPSRTVRPVRPRRHRSAS